MAGPYGRMGRNLHGESLHIRGKLVLDTFANLYVANAEMSNIHVTGNIFTNGICEQEMGNGIYVKGNVTLRPNDVLCASTIKANTIIGNIQGNVNLATITTSHISPLVPVNGFILDTYIPKNRFGLGKVHANSATSFNIGNSTQIIFNTKTYESNFTSNRTIIHPYGNTSVSFQAPSTSNVNCLYTSTLVGVNVGIEFELTGGDFGDYVCFQLRKNNNTIVSNYRYPIYNNIVSSIVPTVAWSDQIRVSPNDKLDVYVYAKDNSMSLAGGVLAGNTYATFKIESLEM